MNENNQLSDNTRVIVRKPFDQYGVIVWSCIVGFLFGSAYELVYTGFTNKFFLFLGMASKVQLLVMSSLVTVILIAVAFVAGLWFLNRCRKPRTTYFVGHAFGSAFMLGILWMSLISDSTLTFGHWLAYILLVAIVFLCVISGVISGALLLLLRQFMVATQGHIVEQDGTRCWACGYIVGAPPTSPRCPECGHQHQIRKKDSEHHRRPILKRWSRQIGIVFASLIVLSITIKAIRHSQAVPLAGSGVQTVNMGMFQINPMDPSVIDRFWESVGEIQVIDSETDMAIAICAVPSRQPNQPCMQIQLGWWNRMSGFNYGDPVIVVDLDCDQGDWIRAHGIPDELLDAIILMAGDNNWKKTLPAPNQFGGILLLDPDQHFPDNLFDDPELK